jgi:hypothetical protein
MHVTWKPIHKNYKANKIMKTYVTKEHKNQDIINTVIKQNIIN